MYASFGTHSELETAKNEFLSDDNDDEKFIEPCHRYKQRHLIFLERGTEWLTLHRQGLFTRGNNTNNYSEATMRIIKDVILNRTKAFNVVALVDFCIAPCCRRAL